MIKTNFNYDFDFESKEYQISRNKLRQKVEKSRAKKAQKTMVFKKIKRYIALGLMAVAVVGTITTAKNFKVAAVRVATNEEVQTILSSNTNNTYSDTTINASEKEIITEEVAIKTVVQEEAIVQPVAGEIAVEKATVQPVVETVVESIVQKEVIDEDSSMEETEVEKVVVSDEATISEEITASEDVATKEDVVTENIIDNIIIYDKAAEELLNAISTDITLTASKASDVMFKSQGGDKQSFNPWEELFGANVYRYPGLRFNIEAKINADRMSVVSGFDNDFYVVVDNIDREGIEYTISLDVEEIMEMISQNGKTTEETKAIIEKHGDFFKQVIEDSKKDIENKMFGSYVEGMKTDNEFYKALNNQLSNLLQNQWKVTVLGADA